MDVYTEIFRLSPLGRVIVRASGPAIDKLVEGLKTCLDTDMLFVLA
jgi:hypothetical protein